MLVKKRRSLNVGSHDTRRAGPGRCALSRGPSRGRRVKYDTPLYSPYSQLPEPRACWSKELFSNFLRNFLLKCRAFMSGLLSITIFDLSVVPPSSVIHKCACQLVRYQNRAIIGRRDQRFQSLGPSKYGSRKGRRTGSGPSRGHPDM